MNAGMRHFSGFDVTRAICLLAALAALSIVTSSWAQPVAWPSRPIRIIVPFGAGTGLDVMARRFAEQIAAQTKVAVTVENRDGAGGTIGAIAVAHSAPDGYTLLFTAHAPFAVGPYMQEGATYDPIGDFTPIAKVALIPMILITTGNSRFKRFDDVAAFAKKSPGKLDYASSGIGTPSNLHMEVIKQQLGLDIVEVPYKNTGQAMTDLIGGQVALYMPSFPAALSQLTAGRVQALVIGSAKRVSALPDVPTVAEVTGRPGLEAGVWYGFLAPKGLSRELGERIFTEIEVAAKSPAIVELVAKIGAEPVHESSENFRNQLRKDADNSRNLLRTLGVKPSK